ncbi:hypothetical protein ACDW_41200 [Acidovorax sp. DW039]|nr:hypothetical protein ACDW_41200 [Acidovorax sp. DW039]
MIARALRPWLTRSSPAHSRVLPWCRCTAGALPLAGARHAY